MKSLLKIALAVCLALSLGPEIAAAKTFKRSDYISQDDIKRAGGGYRLAVKGHGHILVKEIRPPQGSAKKCMVDKKSLSRIAEMKVKAQPAVFKPQWLRMNLYVIEEFDMWICFGLGEGCYILIAAG